MYIRPAMALCGKPTGMGKSVPFPNMTLAYYPSNVRERVPAKVFAKAQLLTQDTRYADIGYEFDEKKFLERTAARLQARDSRGDLPEGWPRVLHGPLVWTGSDFSDESRFVYHLSGCDKADIKNALAYFKSKCQYIGSQ